MDILLLIAGLAMVAGGSHLLVESAREIALTMGIPEWVIGVTIVAAGTSLVASLKRRFGISAGNLIGSDIFNLVGVLGLAGMLTPLHIDEAATGSLYMLAGMIFIVILFMRTGWKLTRVEGAFLVLLGAMRWVMDFY